MKSLDTFGVYDFTIVTLHEPTWPYMWPYTYSWIQQELSQLSLAAQRQKMVK